MTAGVEEYKDLDWAQTIDSSMTFGSGYNSIVSTSSDVGETATLRFRMFIVVHM